MVLRRRVSRSAPASDADGSAPRPDGSGSRPARDGADTVSDELHRDEAPGAAPPDVSSRRQRRGCPRPSAATAADDHRAQRAYRAMHDVARTSKGTDGVLATKKIRVYELARELGVDNAVVVELSNELKIGVKSHSSSIDEPSADRVRRLADARGSEARARTGTGSPERRHPSRRRREPGRCRTGAGPGRRRARPPASEPRCDRDRAGRAASRAPVAPVVAPECRHRTRPARCSGARRGSARGHRAADRASAIEPGRRPAASPTPPAAPRTRRAAAAA